MKKLIIYTVGVLFMLFVAGCGEESSAEPAGNGESASEDSETAEQDQVEISVYSSGSLNVQNYWETIIPMFEKDHPEVKVEFVFVPSGTGGQSTMDRIVAAKQSGNDSGIDVYEGSLADIVRGEEEGGIFYQLDGNGIPNLAMIPQENIEAVEYYSVPYRASAVVLAYNEEKVQDVPNTAEELYQWIHDNPGRFAYNEPGTGGSGDSFMVTTIYNQLPQDAMSSQDESIMEEWDKGFEILKELHPDLYRSGVYPSKNQGTLDLLANGEIDMTPAWSDMALEQLDKNLLPSTIQLKQIDPPFTGGPSHLMVTDNGDDARKQAAEKLLNFVLTVEAQEVVIEQMFGYPGIDWSYLSDELQERFADVSDGYRSFTGGKLQEEMLKRWQREVATQ
ncbi:putative spermidine/putrescine transport system substrate-binding protein [Evansella caseinilytica]|uniref:Putative spermidine/putrescine transport system substrate-binding protein n=1 Tax=Evansella caseinilytica TaxID=1503961 RepID=A0A1H3UKC5_9BACI|nr:extracellular solute-binding protein [Evansella caseinilytica]SDZ62922.1 putative spermidine/putrescine transport system substrate-binding protein [Evansella caseinilytica]